LALEHGYGCGTNFIDFVATLLRMTSWFMAYSICEKVVLR
jgi:hypothetical protein